jgi:hypothetical protein
MGTERTTRVLHTPDKLECYQQTGSEHGYSLVWERERKRRSKNGDACGEF